MQQVVLDKLRAILGSERVLLSEAMDAHVTFRCGGCADVFIKPDSVENLAECIRILADNKEEYFVIGNGSNMLISDLGYRGCIVCVSPDCGSIVVNGDTIVAEAGALLSRIAYAAYENGLTGLEFASGIPGSLGGAVFMNAGAYGSEMKQVVREVSVLDSVTGQIITLSNEEMEFAYRSSVIKKHPYVVLSATMKLTKGDPAAIKAQMDDLAAKRREKQPLEYPSAGSTFKRPEGYFAGKLIEDASLRGYSVGGAMVSTKHCGFVINAGGATTSDVLTLMRDVQTKVRDLFGVTLEPEVCMLGEDMRL